MTKQDKKNFLINFTVDRLTEYLMTDYQLDMPEALNVIYNSQTLKLLQDVQTGLYEQSPGYVYFLLKREYTTGKVN